MILQASLLGSIKKNRNLTNLSFSFSNGFFFVFGTHKTMPMDLKKATRNITFFLEKLVRASNRDKL